MTATIDILRGELERLYSLEEMTNMSQALLGLAPEVVGGQTAKASFARALTERLAEREQLEALLDIIFVSKKEIDPRVRDVAALMGEAELATGEAFGPFVIDRKLSPTDMGIVYLAKRDGAIHMLKTLRREASRDLRAVHRFLTANRLVATVKSDGLPKHIDAGEINGTFFVSYENIDAQPLTARFARTGPSHVNELRPILRGILEPLAAMHKAQLVHGDLKMDHVLVARGEGSASKIILIDFGGDRLRPRMAGANGSYGFLAVFGSPKTIAPEQVRGKAADARTDLYAFGAMVYELLSGKPVFPNENPTDAAFAHLSTPPEPPSAKAPRGWITKEVDAFVLSLLSKDPAQRPKDAQALLEIIDGIGKPVQQKTPTTLMAQDKVDELVDSLVASPNDHEAAMALERAVDQVAEPARIAEAFSLAADQLEVKSDDDKETKKSLLFRAARIYEHQKDKARTEDMYALIIDVDDTDEVALVALEEVRKSQGKFAEVVELLLGRADKARAGEPRARIMAEIGRITTHDLEDVEQGLIAYTQALCELPSSSEIASEIERIAGSNVARWNEVLSTVTDTIKGDVPQTEKNRLLAYCGRWYDQKVSRADMALMAFQQILVSEPASDLALEGLTAIYRKAQQWPELAQILSSRADAAGSSPRGRDLRYEAADVFDQKIGDTKKARDLYGAILSDDPGHAKSGEALGRIAEASGDYKTLVGLLERRADARGGQERIDVIVKIAETYEDHLSDLNEAMRRYEAVLALDPKHLGALKGLDRIFNRTNRYRELLDVLERQITVAATPRQKINLYDRIAALYDEEFLDHEKASAALEEILKVDATHDGALTGLARHYRAQGKWEDVIGIYERHGSVAATPERKMELLLQRARTLADQVGSPERAMRAYEELLELQPGHGPALEALASLKEMSGDANAALGAIEALAAKAATPEAKADQWVRAAKLLESRGDRDGAIERYKAALEANPKDLSAAAALRAAYAARGDAGSVVTLIEKELPIAEGNMAKARLHAELAKLYRNPLKEDQKAEASAKTAAELDPTNADAQVVLGDLAFEAGRFLEASKSYESLVSRTTVLAKEDGIRVLIRFIETQGKLKSPSSPVLPGSSPDVSRPSVPDTGVRMSIIAPPNPRVLAAVEALQRLAPGDIDTASRAAKAVFEHGEPSMARKMYEELLDKVGAKMVGSDRAEALYGLGESARRTGDLDGAIKPLKAAEEADASNPLPVRALAKVYEAKGDWKEAVKAKRRRLEMAAGPERFELFLEIGDIESQKLSDRAGASKSYVAALEERPDDRKLLTRLMQLYSEEKDWTKLVEVVLRLADFVEDPKQRAKYMHTAAIVSSRQIGDLDSAITYYDRALEFDPTLTKALDEALELRKQKADHDGVERLLKVQLEQAKNAQDREKLPKILDQLGKLYEKFLNEPEMAIDAYEAAQAFDPDNKERSEILAELYASDVTQYLDKAVKAQAQILKRNPYRVESYKLLRRLYTEGKRPDPAWCLCQALAVLNLAEPDEERFYRRHKAENAAPAQSAFTEEDWTSRLAHQDLDPLVTRIFALVQQTIIHARTQTLEAQGLDPRYAIDLSLHPYPVSQTLYYVQGVLGFPAPLVFQNPNDPGGLGFVHAHTPALVLGRVAFEASVSTQQMAFIAGRHLTYYRPGYYVRHLVPTGTGLKAWLFAAIKMSVPQFPISADLQGPVTEAMQAMQAMSPADKERLASVVSKLIQSGGALDLKKWVSAVDFTADRAGFVLAHDLSLSTEVMRATEDGASVPSKERMKEIVLFSVSEDYFGLRDKLAITIES